ncbi:MAG: hypothetical protein LUC34_02550 [Campylobacter sp.]|nr:hypothetical protein [Campylobacter sp.]
MALFLVGCSKPATFTFSPSFTQDNERWCYENVRDYNKEVELNLKAAKERIADGKKGLYLLADGNVSVSADVFTYNAPSNRRGLFNRDIGFMLKGASCDLDKKIYANYMYVDLNILRKKGAYGG